MFYERRNGASAAGKRPRVLVFAALPAPYNGSTVMNALVLSRLAKHFELLHVDLSDNRDITNIGRIDFTNVFVALRSIARAVIVAWKGRPDLAYIPISQDFKAFVRDSIYILVSRLFTRRILIHLHGGAFHRFYGRSSPPVRLYIRSILKLCSGGVVLGERLRRVFAGLLPEDRIHVVPNGVEIGRSSGERSASPLRILFLGTLTRTKGVRETIQGFAAIKDQFPDAVLDFAGPWLESDLKQEVMRLIQRHGIAGRVFFHGVVTGQKKWDLYGRASVFVFPTYYEPEGHPLVLLEAMGMGLPIITCDQGSIGEAVSPENALLVPQRNGEAVGNALRLLCADQSLRFQMGRRSREIFLFRFTADTFEAALAELFRSHLSAAAGTCTAGARPARHPVVRESSLFPAAGERALHEQPYPGGVSSAKASSFE